MWVRLPGIGRLRTLFEIRSGISDAWWIRSLQRALASVARIFGVVVIRISTLEKLKARAIQYRFTLNAYQRLCHISRDWGVSSVVDYVGLSRSQLSQDLWVLSVLGAPKSGFFVEFGATNGIDLSNTYLLEKSFGWQGILAEPAKCWWNELARQRWAVIDHRCVWSQSGVDLMFNETKIEELSTINEFSSADRHSIRRQRGKVYSVETVSLLDLLDGHSAPAVIDYLSIDTEGSEYEILSHFDFSRYTFRLITVEHNYSENRLAIFDLLTTHGYRRVLESISDFDDWYVHRSVG